jgi:hypothetical protein
MMIGKQVLIEKHLSNLIYLAKIDDHFDQKERDLVFKIGAKNDIPEAFIQSLIDNSEDIDIVVPKDEQDQYEYLFNLVQMMMIDGKLYQKELDYCVEVAIKLGFKKIIVTVLIRAIEDGLKLGLQAEEIKKEAFELIAD